MKIRVLGSFFGVNLEYKQAGYAYLEFELKSRKADKNNFIEADKNNFIDAAAYPNEAAKTVNNEFAVIIHDARVQTSSGTKMKQNKFVGPTSAITRRCRFIPLL